MKTALRKMGNSEGVIIPKPILTEAGVRTSDQFEISVKEGKIILAPTQRHPRAGWAEESKAIHEAGDDKLVWPDFPNEADKDWQW
jgi:antitoxin MazE